MLKRKRQSVGFYRKRRGNNLERTYEKDYKWDQKVETDTAEKPVEKVSLLAKNCESN